MKIFQRILSALIVIVMLSLFFTVPASAKETYTTENLRKIADEIISWKKSDVGIDKSDNLLSEKYLDYAGSTSGDWYPIAMNRLGVEDDYNSYLSAVESYVISAYKTPDKLSRNKATEWHRISLCMLACGGNPENVSDDNINLISDGTYNRGKTAPLGRQGINGWVWALITLDADNFSVPENACDTRENIINEILKNQNQDGGWSISGDKSDVDMTAMALQSLSMHQEEKGVSSSVDKALVYLSEQQNKSAGFESWGIENAESTSQVIIALTSLGISPFTDKRFIKNGKNTIDALMSYRCADGGFTHSYTSDSNNPTAVSGDSNSMASEQALLAVSAVVRFMEGKTSVYDFSDISKSDAGLTKEDMNLADNLPEKPTTQYYKKICLLLIKAENSDNKEYINILTKKKDYIDTINKKIENINSDISNLYPINDLSSSDKGKINSIIKDYNTLSDYDKGKVIGYDDLVRAKAVVEEKQRNFVIFITLTIILVLIVAVFVLRIRSKRKNKKQIYFEED